MCKTHIYHIWKVEIIKKMFYLGWKRRETLWAYLTMSPATMNPSTASIRNGREQRWWWCWRDIKIYPRQLHGKTRNPGTDQAGIRLKKATMDVCRGNFHPCKPCPSSARQFQSLRRSYLFWMSAPAERKQSRRVEKSDLLGGGGQWLDPIYRCSYRGYVWLTTMAQPLSRVQKWKRKSKLFFQITTKKKHQRKPCRWQGYTQSKSQTDDDRLCSDRNVVC